MAKTLEQIGCEQRILLSKALSNKPLQEVLEEFKNNCSKLNINYEEKQKAMMEHFNFFVNTRWQEKCECCIEGNKEISKLQWNRYNDNEKKE